MARKLPHEKDSAWTKATPAEAHKQGEDDFGEWTKGRSKGAVIDLRDALAAIYGALLDSRGGGTGALKDIQKLLHHGDTQFSGNDPEDWLKLRDKKLLDEVIKRLKDKDMMALGVKPNHAEAVTLDQLDYWRRLLVDQADIKVVSPVSVKGDPGINEYVW